VSGLTAAQLKALAQALETGRLRLDAPPTALASQLPADARAIAASLLEELRDCAYSDAQAAKNVRLLERREVAAEAAPARSPSRRRSEIGLRGIGVGAW